jgi:hypothetical protein
MLPGGVSMHAAAKARREFAMPCGFVRFAPMGMTTPVVPWLYSVLRLLAILRGNRLMVHKASIDRR